MMVPPKSFVFLVILSVGAMAMPHVDRHTAAMITRSCESLSPAGDVHGTTIQTTTTSPYTITVSANKVKAGGKLTVTITGDADNSFKGFMVQARDNQNHKIGTFVSTDDNAQTLTCDKTDDTIIQKSIRSEKPTVSFEWIAPASEDVHGEVVFYVTIVKSLTVFWVKLPSAPLTVE